MERWASRANAMKRAKVLTVTSGSHLEAAIPGRYRDLITPAMRRAREAMSVLVFGEKVARLRQVKEALSEVALDAKCMLAFASDMTVEARAFLEERGATVHTLRSFGWDEARYRSITS